MLTLFGSLRSRALRPLWLLRELDAPHKWVPVIQTYRLSDPTAPDAPFHTGRAEFLAINPLGKIPAMVDGDLRLSESVAITLYCAQKFGGALAPMNDTEHALALQWALFGVTEVEKPALDILMTYHQGDPESPQGQATLAASRAALMRPLRRLEAHAIGHEWLLGDRFTVADILLAECVRFAADDVDVFAPLPGISRWLRAAQARPVYQSLWAERTLEPVSFP